MINRETIEGSNGWDKVACADVVREFLATYHPEHNDDVVMLRMCPILYADFSDMKIPAVRVGAVDDLMLAAFERAYAKVVATMRR